MTTNENLTPDEQRDEELKKVIAALFHRSVQALKIEFPEHKVSGHVKYHNLLGPFFGFELKDEANDLNYSCGFTFNELIEKHKDEANARTWLSSFFIDMIDEKVSRPLPKEPADNTESNEIVKDQVLPHIIKAIREEFGEKDVVVRYATHPKFGPIFEAAMPAIKEGNNISALPINLLLALHLLNRDCADPIINGLYKISEEAKLKQ